MNIINQRQLRENQSFSSLSACTQRDKGFPIKGPQLMQVEGSLLRGHVQQHSVYA